jgi:ubiquinone/menaquinone biosynthesis C-methylase UbiE
MDRLLREMHRILKPGGTMAVWPPSWVHRSIRRSGIFAYSSTCRGVMNYLRTACDPA